MGRGGAGAGGRDVAGGSGEAGRRGRMADRCQGRGDLLEAGRFGVQRSDSGVTWFDAWGSLS